MNTLHFSDRILGGERDGEEARLQPAHVEMLPSFTVRRGKMKEAVIARGEKILKQNHAGDFKFSSQAVKKVAIIPPELVGDCEEMGNWLDSLIWDLTEDKVKAAALNLIKMFTLLPTPELLPELMMVAIRWIQDEVDPYADLDYCESWRLHALIADEENQTAKQIKAAYQIFRKEMRKVGFDLPESFPEHVIPE